MMEKLQQQKYTEVFTVNIESFYLGTILREPKLMLKTLVKPEHFEFSKERRVFEAMQRIVDRGEMVSEGLVMQEAGVELSYLLDLNHADLEYWKSDSAEQTIIEKAKIRKIKIVAEKVMKSNKRSEELVRLFDEIKAETLNQEIREVQDAYTFTKDSSLRYQQRKRGEGDKAISTGIGLLDDFFMGFKKRKLYYVGARPSQGKTALLLNFFANTRGKALFLSCESGVEELSDRLMVRQSRVDSKEFFRGELSEDKERAFDEKVDEIGKQNRLFMLYDGELTVDKIRTTAYQYKEKHNIEAVFIDYLQLIKPRDLSIPRHEQVAEISRSMKHLANDLGIPVVVAVQLRREADGVAPLLRDFSDSTQIERDADVAMLLHNTTVIEDEMPVSFIFIRKNRDGQTGHVPIHFERKHFHFQAFPDELTRKINEEVDRQNNRQNNNQNNRKS
jgi:replicative DNA helicase